MISRLHKLIQGEHNDDRRCCGKRLPTPQQQRGALNLFVAQLIDDTVAEGLVVAA